MQMGYKVILGVIAALAVAFFAMTGSQTLYDNLGIFTEQEQLSLTQYHQKLLEGYDIDYRILTDKVDGDLGLYANAAFRQLKVGESSKAGKGLLLVLDPNQNQVRLEVSTALEHVYTDSFIAYLQNRQMVPFFASGQVANGILATTEMVFTRAQEAAQNKDFMPPNKASSAGGGAQTEANIGAGESGLPKYQSQKTIIGDTDGLTPTQVVEAYHQAMQNRDASADLPIYSKESQQLIKQWAMTPAQMDNVAKTFAKCRIDEALILLDLAAVRYDVKQRQCSPYFLLYEDGAWRLDLAAMFSVIQFNHNNYWHLKPKTHNPYGFAFGGWTFDKNRYPHMANPEKLRWAMSVQAMYDRNTYISWVAAGGAGEKAGFQYGDQLVSWMGNKEINFRNIFSLMNQSEPGEKVWFTVIRDGKEMRLEAIAPPYKD